MIVSDAWRGKRYAVLGLARSGLATVRALVASGAEVVAWDEREEARANLSLSPSGERLGEGAVHFANPHTPLSQPSPLKGRGLSFADPLTIDLSGFDGIVVSPGVPINRHPIADAARAANVPLIGDIELFAQARPGLPPHKVVGITGTNGKSTTTALIHHILKTAGVPSLMGGNIGLPILGQEPLPDGGVYVLELSSFQIDLTHSLDCDVAVLLNITPDHLDRYEDLGAYGRAKARLFNMQNDKSLAVVAGRDAISREIWDDLDARGWPLVEVPATEVDDRDWPTLKGPHNWQNAGVAVAVATSIGIDSGTIERGLRTYPGLPHRMERIRERRDVLFVNDSKATNPTSTAPALAAYPAIHWILGGQAKTDDLDACAPHFDHVRAAYTIGDAAPMFARLLSSHMPVAECGMLDVAVASAAQAAKPGETVLLSPACASFDQFRDYEDRGDRFRTLVAALP